MSRYKTRYGLYRPEKPKFTIEPNVKDLKGFDSASFDVRMAYQTYTENYDGLLYRDVMLFSEDGRFCAVPMKEQAKSEFLSIERNPWLIAEQVGFYTLLNDTLKVEYFTNFQGGQYHTFKGVVSDNGKTLRVFEYYQGLGRHKVEINKPHRSKLGRISQVVVKY